MSVSMELEIERHAWDEIEPFEGQSYPKRHLGLEHATSQRSLGPDSGFDTSSSSRSVGLFTSLDTFAPSGSKTSYDLASDPMGVVQTGDFLMQDEPFGISTTTPLTAHNSAWQLSGHNGGSLPGSFTWDSPGMYSQSTFGNSNLTSGLEHSWQFTSEKQHHTSGSSLNTNFPASLDVKSPGFSFHLDNNGFSGPNLAAQFQDSDPPSLNVARSSSSSRRPIPIRSRKSGPIRPNTTSQPPLHTSGVSKKSSSTRRHQKFALRNADVTGSSNPASKPSFNVEANIATALEYAQDNDFFSAWSAMYEEPNTDCGGSSFPDNVPPCPLIATPALSEPYQDGFPIFTPDPFQDCDRWAMSATNVSFDMNNFGNNDAPGEDYSLYATAHANTATWSNANPTAKSPYLTVPKPTRRNRGKSDPLPFSQDEVFAAIPMDKSLSNPVPTPFQSSFQNIEEAFSGERALSTSETSTSTPVFPPSSRGKRVGPMKENNRIAARKKRNDRTMCIGCKISKVACRMVPGTDSCEKCLKVTSESRVPLVCTKAYFLDIVIAGTTNYISQYSINHLRKDQIHRKRLDLPPILNFEDLLPNVESLGHGYHIRVLQGTTPLYVLNLSVYHKYLSGLSRTLKIPSHAFRGFIDSQLNNSKNDDWMPCIADRDVFTDLLKLLVHWNNMPSRVTYKLVSKRDGSERLLDPDSPSDEQIIYTAAQLSRIINRKLELAAYHQLQKILNDSSPITVPLLANLGHLLLTLRWRISWWNLLGSGASTSSTAAEHREKDKFTNRVQSLCRILYFYYCSMRRRLPSCEDRSDLEGKVSSYADTQRNIWEAFPKLESIAGFEAWMKEGEMKIREANVVAQLKKIGLS